MFSNYLPKTEQLSEEVLQTMSLRDLNEHIAEVRNQDLIDRSYEAIVNRIRLQKGLPPPIVLGFGSEKR